MVHVFILHRKHLKTLGFNDKWLKREIACHIERIQSLNLGTVLWNGADPSDSVSISTPIYYALNLASSDKEMTKMVVQYANTRKAETDALLQ